MTSGKTLIVNADDFGLSTGVNRGIVSAHEHGIVTSASLMVRWPTTTEAAAYARRRRQLSLGLHFDFGEWAYRGTQWVAVYEVIDLEDAQAVKKEAARQLAIFRELISADPTHLDSHQHAHRREPARSALIELANDLGVPLRHEYAEVRYCGDFYGQDADGRPIPENLTVDHLTSILARLSLGTTELCCHPGEMEDLSTMYCRERAQELAVLCNPAARAAVMALGIELCSFANFQPSSTSRWLSARSRARSETV